MQSSRQVRLTALGRINAPVSPFYKSFSLSSSTIHGGLSFIHGMKLGESEMYPCLPHALGSSAWWGDWCLKYSPTKTTLKDDGLQGIDTRAVVCSAQSRTSTSCLEYLAYCIDQVAKVLLNGSIQYDGHTQILGPHCQIRGLKGWKSCQGRGFEALEYRPF